MLHVISYEELLSILQDSDFEENYSDSNHEFEEDTSGVYIIEPDSSICPFVSESRITNYTTASLSPVLFSSSF